MMAITQSSVALLLVVAAANTVSEAANLRQVPRNLGATYAQSDDYFSAMLAAVNTERAAQGLSALCMNKKLHAAAQRHSDDQAKNNFMAHDGSDGSTMSKRVTDAGYKWNAVAENVAAGQVDVVDVMESWMNSPGHRANILGADYTMFGTAYSYNADSTYKHYWTQDFGAGSNEACDAGDSSGSNKQDLVAQNQDSSQNTPASGTVKPTSQQQATTAPFVPKSPVIHSSPKTGKPTTGKREDKDCD
jgi:uncharacterized protein YkwD